MSFFSGAVNRFRLLNPQGYNIPKPKFMYYVNFVTNDLTTQNQKTLSYLVKRIDRLQMTYDVTEMNQYNKKRLIQGKIQYGPLNFSFYDVVGGTAAKLIEAYNRFYFDDFLSKNNTSWSYDIIGKNFEDSPGWGLAGRLSPNNNYFLNRIEVYEIYDQYYSKMSFINPKFTMVDMQGLNVEESGGNEINVTAKYEGLVFEALVNPITQELADMFGLPFHNELFTGLNNSLNISGPDLTSGVKLPSNRATFSSVANILNNAVGGGLIAPIFNTVNNALNGGVESLIGNVSIPQINGLFGTPIGGSVPSDMSIDKLGLTAGDIKSIENTLNAGQPARNITTGNFNLGNFNVDPDEA